MARVGVGPAAHSAVAGVGHGSLQAVALSSTQGDIGSDQCQIPTDEHGCRDWGLWCLRQAQSRMGRLAMVRVLPEGWLNQKSQGGRITIEGRVDTMSP